MPKPLPILLPCKLAVAFALLFAASACDLASDARKELTSIGVRYTPQDFVETAYNNDLRAVELFVRAGSGSGDGPRRRTSASGRHCEETSYRRSRAARRIGLAAIRAAKERLQPRQRETADTRGRQPGSKRNLQGGRPYQREHGEPGETAQDNFTDPQSRIMKISAAAFWQCYNAQVAVEGGNQLIVATGVTSTATD